MKRRRLLLFTCMSLLAGLPIVIGQKKPASDQDRIGRIVRNWSERDLYADFWIYGDLQKARELAQKTGRPLLLTYRCVP